VGVAVRAAGVLAGACAFVACSVAHADSFEGTVVRIADGDILTVHVSHEMVRIRLIDIDAPEKKQAFGTRSRQSLGEICHGKRARVDDRGLDRYGRTLGQVTCAGVDANAEQVRRGMAWVYVRYAPKDSHLYGIEADARLHRRGLWQDASPVPPWEWRAKRAR
jgi:endonuclease YncB( thermonuclease family)